MTANCKLLNPITTAWMPLNARSNSNFPLQLWDKLTPQVQDTLNMLQASRIDLTKSAYEILNGPYNWNHYPLAPLRCKAVVYKDGDTQGSWVSRGVDAFYVGPWKDHYCCDLYYVLDTRAYRVSGSMELFQQHCQVPSMTPHLHFCALTDELTKTTNLTNKTPKGRQLLRLLSNCIDQLLAPPPPLVEQRVGEVSQREACKAEQRVIDAALIITIPWLTDAPAIIQSRNPTANRALKNTPCLHRRVTRNNTLGISPVTTVIALHGPTPSLCDLWQSSHTRVQLVPPLKTYTPIPTNARQRIVTQQAINILTIQEQVFMSTIHMPRKLMKINSIPMPIKFEHFASPIVHPVTGKTISSYKKLMHDPATAKMWQTAFGKDFGRMAQGCNKTGQRGTNEMFVMTHDKICHAFADKKNLLTQILLLIIGDKIGSTLHLHHGQRQLDHTRLRRILPHG
jgi:hypothetical protein